MSKDNTHTELEHAYDLMDKAKALGRTLEKHIEELEKENAYEKDRKRKLLAAREQLRDGYSHDLDLAHVDIERVRADLGIPRGHSGTAFIKSEVRRLKRITHQSAE